jgi:hypothetical protein
MGKKLKKRMSGHVLESCHEVWWAGGTTAGLSLMAGTRRASGTRFDVATQLRTDAGPPLSFLISPPQSVLTQPRFSRKIYGTASNHRCQNAVLPKICCWNTPHSRIPTTISILGVITPSIFRHPRLQDGFSIEGTARLDRLRST